MTIEQRGPLEALALSGANARAYLSALFAAWRAGRLVMALPKTPPLTTVPGVKVLDRQSFSDEPGWFDEDFTPIDSTDPALIAFSSGTTGRPKALLLQHRALADVVGRINAAMGIDGSIREYIGVPVTYSFGAGRARAVAAAGGRSFLPAHGFDPAEIARMLNAGEINAVSAVPTLWRVVLANPDIIGAAGRRLRWIEIGSQYMSGAEKQALKRLFPEARIVQHYGLTEASRSALLDVSATEGAALDSVGRATGAVEIAIAADGAIRIRGPHLAAGLVSGAGLKPIADAEGWLTTADRGRIEDGLLYYEGRIDELINVGGLKIDPTQFEQRLIEAVGPGLAVGREADTLRGERVLVAIEDGAGLDRKAVETAAKRVAESFGLTGAGALAFRKIAEIPRTATGKVQRKALSDAPETGPVTAAPAPAPAPAAPNPAETKAAELQKLWAEVLGVDSVGLHDSFYDLGGDSLSALTVIIRMEALGLDPETARGIFDGKTIAEITGATGQPVVAAPAATAAPAPAPAPAAPNPAETKAVELQKLWAEVLGVDSVGLHDSFYDLGGDSLSALTVIIRMEALGLDPETARGIFDGKTIAEITGATGQPVVAAPAATAAPAPAPAAPNPAETKAVELQKLWAEVLGVDSVGLHDSFYDLGGDSLSALTVIIRMEALGLDPETARGIFDGKTIAEIVKIDPVSAPTAPATPAATPAPAQATGKAVELQKLWAEVLGVDSVGLHDSFYDLGGDSLSALTVIIRMEALGLDPETARGIFDGKTIAELVGTEAPAPAPVAPGPADVVPPATAEPVFAGTLAAAPPPTATPAVPGLTLAQTMNAVHATRGVLILWVVVVHWLPGVLARLPGSPAWVYEAMVPILRFGTPGFAMVFGLGLGALGLVQYHRNPAQFLKGARFNTLLIVSGVLVMAVVRFLLNWSRGGLDNPELPSALFYSAVSFYALAMLTMPLVMRVMSLGRNRFLTLMTLFVGAVVIHEALAMTVAPLQPGGVLELLKILLTAKYGYFHMMSYVMVGAAMGWMFRAHHAEPGMPRDLVTVGLCLIAFGFVLLYEVDPTTMLDRFGAVQPWHLMIYAGLALLILAGFCRLNRIGARAGRPWRWLNAFAIASGILALPIFVGHEIVIPLKDLLHALGLPEPLALLLPLGLFLAVLGLAYGRLVRFLMR